MCDPFRNPCHFKCVSLRRDQKREEIAARVEARYNPVRTLF